MEMMEENSEGKMEFPRDMMMEDCFSDVEEPLYGFVTNVTIPEDMLKPCIVDVECTENGTRINATENIEERSGNRRGSWNKVKRSSRPRCAAEWFAAAAAKLL